jgi:DNA-binding CsgD family transcriptional regulator
VINALVEQGCSWASSPVLSLFIAAGGPRRMGGLDMQCPLLALAAPFHQRGRMQPLAAENRPGLARLGAVEFGENRQLVGGREGPALKSGAEDFIEKPFNDLQLLDEVALAIRKSRQRLTEGAEHRLVKERLGRLSRREREVLDLVVQGKQNKIIAAELELSIKTVEVHRHGVMEKMAVNSVAELARVMALAG